MLTPSAMAGVFTENLCRTDWDEFQKLLGRVSDLASAQVDIDSVERKNHSYFMLFRLSVGLIAVAALAFAAPLTATAKGYQPSTVDATVDLTAQFPSIEVAQEPPPPPPDEGYEGEPEEDSEE